MHDPMSMQRLARVEHQAMIRTVAQRPRTIQLRRPRFPRLSLLAGLFSIR